MSPNSLLNNVWHYTGIEAVSNWVSGHRSSSACCHSTSAVANVSEKMKGQCSSAAGHMKRFGSGGGSTFVRVAGFSGALAVAFGAYGAHVFNQKQVPDELKKVYETGNQYHLIHSLALMAVPVTRRPAITGSLFLLGMLLFCGSCYVHALTEYKPIRAVTPYGGMLLIGGWISMLL